MFSTLNAHIFNMHTFYLHKIVKSEAWYRQAHVLQSY
jgi:hypothetical protein